MHIKSLVATATTFAALLPSVLAGTARVKNNCPHPVYLWPVANTGNVPSHTINPGGTYDEQYRANPNGGGISLKISNTPSDATITQFEYTLAGSKVFYDISNINGYPLVHGGVSLTPSSGQCPAVICPAGEHFCNGAYNQPDDNHATHACSSSADLTMTLCLSGTQQIEQQSQQRSPQENQSQPRQPRHPRQFSF
ncbi:hypothetical protein EMCG_05349 [[Emmonsia] crescens]|uniref:Antigenic thaumatin-like protein n=1 Tax=[Emmonsia] crescens TaxID=73230 RepID=A0A0G2HQ77_9EURO|nr:hypothetical protein EMCG_05349 [Emmonsia crescens UAMH 3008]